MTTFSIEFRFFVRVEFASACKAVSFSLRHRLQDLIPGWYGAVWATMLHFMWGFFLHPWPAKKL